MHKKMSSRLLLILFSTVIALSGCGKSQKQINFEQNFKISKSVLNIVDLNYKSLENKVNKAYPRGKYEQILLISLEKIQKEFPNSPEVKSMVSQFKRDTTSSGVIFPKFKKDYELISSNSLYNQVKNASDFTIKHNRQYTNYFAQVIEANKAIGLEKFDEHFIDYINILASISTNIKPVVVQNLDSKNAPLGSQLVGNPAYGQWTRDPRTGHNSWSFLEMYGFMSIMDNSFNNGRYNYGYSRGYNSSYGSRYRYDNWKSNRNWSYSGDVYSKKYATTNTRSKYKSSLKSVSNNKLYKNKKFANKNLKAQNTKIASSKSSKFKSNLKSKSARTKSSGYSKKPSSSSTSKSKSKYSSNIRSSNSSSRSSSRGK